MFIWVIKTFFVHFFCIFLPPLPNFFCLIEHAKAFDCVDHNKLENSQRFENTRSPYLPSEKGQEAMVFTLVMYGCESWTMKKAECQRIDAFELWCWRRLLRVPWTARRSDQSILEEISPVCSLIGLMLKLKLQYFDHLMQRAESFEKILSLGMIEGWRRRR